MKKVLVIFITLISVSLTQAQDAKMNDFITKLMSRMTVEEKIGQLNLVIPRWRRYGFRQSARMLIIKSARETWVVCSALRVQKK
ncbi:MAG: hypothetical protein WDM78_21255 [Puia sp.]